jgi:hypothetical protein
LYLPSSLKSINNLWKIYDRECTTDQTASNFHLKVGYRMFYNVFVNEFNIGFSGPASDTCTTCDCLRNQLKVCPAEQKTNLMTKLRVHKLRARAFYDLLKERNEGIYTVTYDLQQVQSLPKVTVQEAYYSRQLSLYNFGLVDMNNNKNYSYTWLESQAARGSNEIASAVRHFLDQYLPKSSNFNTVQKVRFVSDGCGGQNKNNIIVGMVQSWLFQAPEHIQMAELIFPVRGHSFLPCDRLFGRIEKELRTRDSILDPTEYHEIFSHHCSSVNILDKDWKVSDWKLEVGKHYKPLQNIQEVKRIVLTKSVNAKGRTVILTTGEVNFRSSIGTSVCLLKRGKSHGNINPAPLPSKRPISKAKLNDVHKLLSVTFGNGWKDLPQAEVYRNLTCSETVRDDIDLPAADCNCADEDIGFQI